jgi:hypothetical protein
MEAQRLDVLASPWGPLHQTDRRADEPHDGRLLAALLLDCPGQRMLSQALGAARLHHSGLYDSGRENVGAT